MKNILKHLHTVNSHRIKVLHYSIKVGIPLNGFKHDLSKYGKEEFFKSAKYYKGTSSPIFEERKNNNLISYVSLHHTNHNKHHWEYWIDIVRGNLLSIKMPFTYATEYCLDMISASKTYNKKSFQRDFVLNYFLEREKNYMMHPATKEYVIYVLNEYKDNGFKNLKRKKLKAIYKSINDKYEDAIIITTPYSASIEDLKKK